MTSTIGWLRTWKKSSGVTIRTAFGSTAVGSGLRAIATTAERRPPPNSAMGTRWGSRSFRAWARDHFRRRFTALVRRLKPACLVSFGNTTPVVSYGFTNYMDYQSGDWFSPSNHRYAQSLAMRCCTTLGIPYEAMTCDTAYALGLGTRSLPKTLDRMLRGASVLINGGKWIYWTYPMPHGTDPSQMRRAKTCRDWVAEREDLWLGTQSPLDRRGP